ncbi:hypothetical protein BaRGS_00030086, partial [Batillaria attramentaria]
MDQSLHTAISEIQWDFSSDQTALIRLVIRIVLWPRICPIAHFRADVCNVNMIYFSFPTEALLVALFP